ncbi:MAG: glycine cleavage system protein GcvH [Candidatus Gracilibacteria bacterium]|nr:glycine cleavage system protein GcvH [Candidatus Gracilibacteria bacterium]
MHPNDRQYCQEHTWAKLEGSIAICGITKYAEEMLNDVVYSDLPRVGKQCEQAKACGILESIKSVSDVYSPLSGEVVEVNDDVVSDPAFVNKDPMGAGWLFKLKPSNLDEVKNLLDAEAYEKFLKDAAQD